MQIRLFTIPNMLTLGNLVCGSAAVVALLAHSDFELAFWLVVASAVCDFFDGFAARLLKSSSPLGVELDSLADMVSFGLVPSVALFCTYNSTTLSWLSLDDKASYVLGFVTFVVVALSALRLAKFNIDTEQATEFVGLPTPANALLCLSVALLQKWGDLSLSGEAVLILAVVMAWLLISPIRMFALKFKGFGWKGNELRYLFLIISALVVVVVPRYAITIIILLYIAISVCRWAINLRKK